MTKQRDTQSNEATSQIAESLQQLTVTTQQIANCLGFLVIRFSDYRKKPDTERIPFLNRLGFDRHAIAGILGTTPNTVSVQLSRCKAAKKRKTAAAEED